MEEEKSSLDAFALQVGKDRAEQLDNVDVDEEEEEED